MTRELIVNADDFGRSPQINAGILRAHAAGIVTSASLMVRWPAARAAVDAARRYPRLGVGLHLDLGEWVFDGGRWDAAYEVVDLDDEEAVRREVETQVLRFRRLVARDPTHVDSHQHVHRGGCAARVAARLARELRVPLRGRADGIVHRGDFYGRTATGDPLHDAIGPDNLVALIETLPGGVTELSCHPGGPGCDDPAYGAERALEVRALTHPRVHAAVRRNAIVLRSFARPACAG